MRPAFYLKTRSFATSLRRPPFIINYTGQLFRLYPEVWQSVLETGSGKTKLCGTTVERPTNKDFRDMLTTNLRVDGVPQEELMVGVNLSSLALLVSLV